MKEHYDFSNARKNPYAEKLKKEGYTVAVHYTPEDLCDRESEDGSLLKKDEEIVLL